MVKRSEELKAIDQKIEKLTIQKNILKAQVNEYDIRQPKLPLVT